MIGRTLAHYRITAQLGEGGMGVVYRARDQRLGRDVALKLLPLELTSDSTARARLLREARAASALNHPGICTIYEVGEAEGLTYIAMECVEGRSLSEAIGARGLPPDTVVRHGIEIAEALAHAHERGVTHRDLKTSNVLVTGEGRVRVLDFGLARRADEEGGAGKADATLTETSAIAGTPHCLAPELLRGEKADARSDLWALGVLLYEAACGARPFRGDTNAEVSASILSDPPAPLPPRVPEGLARVIERCLAKDLAQRYRAAGEVRAALEALAGAASPAESAAPATRRGPAALWIAASAIVGVVLAALLIANFGGVRDRLLGRAAGGRITSLAVLPLTNFSRDPEQDYFADGMTDELITDLAQIGAVRIVSRTSVMRFKNTTLALPEIARQLGVDAVIEGSVQRSGERVRINAQLVRGANDQHLWAKSYERNLSDALALQAEVAQAIADEVRAQLSPLQRQRLANARTVSPRAYELYLRALDAYKRYNKAGTQTALGYLDQAISEDSTYAPTWAAVAQVHIFRASGRSATREHRASGRAASREQEVAEARRAVQRALLLDEGLGLAHSVSAQIEFQEDWHWADAEREFKRAIELSPNLFEAHHYYSHLLLSLGRVAESLEQSRLALALDPLSAPANLHLGWHFLYSGDYPQAIRAYQATLRLDPSYAPAYNQLSSAYALSGHFDEAHAAFRKSLLGQSSDSTMTVAIFMALRGQKAEAARLLPSLIAGAKRGEESPYDVAQVMVALGRREEAFYWLERAFAQRDEEMPSLKADPFLAPLRTDPRFTALVRRMGLPA